MAHADREAPKECCGFVMMDGKIIKASNRHEDPENYFLISPQKFFATKKKGLIKAIYHSHVNGCNDFSGGDIAASRALGIPYILYFQPKPRFFYFDPNAIQPYEGREFHYAYQNCYSLACDYYKQELKIEMKPFYPAFDGQWNDPSFDPIAEIKPEEQGFAILPPQAEIRLHDVVCIKNAGQQNAAHLGIIVDVERSHMLHHENISEVVVYGGWYRDNTRCIFRHRSLM